MLLLMLLGLLILVQIIMWYLILLVWRVQLNNNQLCVGDDKWFFISNIAHSIIHRPKCTFTISNRLHDAHIKKPLLSVQNFYLGNNIFFLISSIFFYVKDLITIKVFLFHHSVMVCMLSLSFLQCFCLKLSCLYMFMLLLIFDIVDLGILVHEFWVF
jgi:hypothetical protein